MKKLFFFLFPVLILLLGLSGCAMSMEEQRALESLEKDLDSLIGHHISFCIRKMGPPNQTTDDGAGGHIYIWEEYSQRVISKPYMVESPRQPTKTPSVTTPTVQTKTRGKMRWDPVFERWEFESETESTSSRRSISDIVREADNSVPQRQLRFRYETRTSTGRIMFYTRDDGTIYHWLLVNPSNRTYSHNNRKNTKKNVSDYNNQKHADEIKKYDSIIYLFPDDAKAYFKRGMAKYKLGLTSEGKTDLSIALRLATQKGDVKLKNSIEGTLRELQ